MAFAIDHPDSYSVWGYEELHKQRDAVIKDWKEGDNVNVLTVRPEQIDSGKAVWVKGTIVSEKDDLGRYEVHLHCIEKIRGLFDEKFIKKCF